MTESALSITESPLSMTETRESVAETRRSVTETPLSVTETRLSMTETLLATTENALAVTEAALGRRKERVESFREDFPSFQQMPSSYLPLNEGQLVVWFLDYAAGVALYGATLGLTVAEIAQVQADAAEVQLVVNGQQTRKTDAQAWTAYKDIILYADLNTPKPPMPSPGDVGEEGAGVKAAIIARNRQFIQRMKSHSAYTLAMGNDMGIEAGSGGAPVDQAELGVEVQTAFAIKVTFAMHGHDMIEIWCKRGSEADFTMIGVDTNSPYIDNRAPLVSGQPETRQYKARYRDNDIPVGTWSEVVTATAQA